jgi:hypothetical protein
MARSQPIELKLGQALRVCYDLGKLEIGSFSRSSMTKSEGKAKEGEMGTIVPLRGTIVPLRGTIVPQERVGTRTNEAAGLIVLSPNSVKKDT